MMCSPDGISDPPHPAVPPHPPHNYFLCSCAMLALVSDAGRGLKVAVHGMPTAHSQKLCIQTLKKQSEVRMSSVDQLGCRRGSSGEEECDLTQLLCASKDPSPPSPEMLTCLLG